MKIYKELESLGFFEWLSETHNLKDTDMKPEYLDELPLNDIHRTVSNSMAFRWFREKHNLYSEINLDSYKEPYSLKVTIKHLDDTNTFVDKEYLPYSNGIGDIDNKNYEEAEQTCLDKLIEIIKAKKT